MPQLWAIFTTGHTTNAATEGVNRKVKAVKRAGYGFRNQTNYLLRVRLHCGHTRYRQQRQKPAPPLTLFGSP